MSSRLSSWLRLGAPLLALSLAVPFMPAPASASACTSLPAELARDPLGAEGFRVVDAKKVYRVQVRPYAHIPAGVMLLVRAPAGVTAADVHRAALCHASDGSPLAVPGATLHVRRSGDLYELHITTSAHGSALEVQRRTERLSAKALGRETRLATAATHSSPW